MESRQTPTRPPRHWRPARVRRRWSDSGPQRQAPPATYPRPGYETVVSASVGQSRGLAVGGPLGSQVARNVVCIDQPKPVIGDSATEFAALNAVEGGLAAQAEPGSGLADRNPARLGHRKPPLVDVPAPVREVPVNHFQWWVALRLPIYLPTGANTSLSRWYYYPLTQPWDICRPLDPAEICASLVL